VGLLLVLLLLILKVISRAELSMVFRFLQLCDAGEQPVHGCPAAETWWAFADHEVGSLHLCAFRAIE